MTEFTPWVSLFGGTMIGLSAVLLMLWEGRIAGISGIAGRLLSPYRDKGFLSRLGFVVGIIAAPLMISLANGAPISQTISSNIPLMIVAGLVVSGMADPAKLLNFLISSVHWTPRLPLSSIGLFCVATHQSSARASIYQPETTLMPASLPVRPSSAAAALWLSAPLLSSH